MDTGQTKIVLTAIAAVLAAWLIIPLFASFRAQTLPPSNTPSSFNAPEAYRIVHDFATQYPNRVLGSLESRQSTGFIKDSLEKLGYSISYSHFDARIAGSSKAGRSVLGYRQGSSPEIIAVVAHLDTARTTVQGATDNASGVGVLLELARVMSTGPTNHSLLMIFSDGEEWGMLGVRDLAVNYPEWKRIKAALSLDHVGAGELGAFCLEATGQLQGYSPPWLRQMARTAAESQNLPVHGKAGFSEYLDRAFLVSGADQGPFLSAGIPAINLGSESKDKALEARIYHSPEDTIEKLKPDSIRTYGLAAERIVRTLDELHSIPEKQTAGLRLWNDRFVRQGAVSVLQILCFIPLLLAIWLQAKNHLTQLSAIAVGREMMAFLGTVLPFWIIYFFIQIASRLRFVPLYSLYPAALKDPRLENPPWAVVGSILGTALLAAVVCYVIAKLSFQDLPKPAFAASKLVLLLILLIAVIVGTSYNLYWTSAFLFLPACVWALVGWGRTSSGRVTNVMLILAAGAVYYAALILYGSKLNLGLNFVWYQMLALNSGLFTKTAFFLATAVIAVGIRLAAIQWHEKAE